MPANESALADINTELRARFGAVMSTAEVASALKMTVAALRMARSRKVLPIQPLDIEGRRGQIYRTDDVADLLSLWISKGAESALSAHAHGSRESQSGAPLATSGGSSPLSAASASRGGRPASLGPSKAAP